VKSSTRLADRGEPAGVEPPQAPISAAVATSAPSRRTARP
jgi:hypothetical protein